MHRYEALLHTNNISALWQQLYTAQQHNDLCTPNPLTRILQPRIVSKKLAARVALQISRLAEAATRFCHVALQDSSLLDEIGLTPEEREIVTCPAPPGLGLTRVDGFLGEDAFRVVEWNGGCPAGGAYVDILARAFADLDVFQAYTLETPLSYQACAPQVLRTLLAHYKAAGGREISPYIAVVDFAGLATANEHRLFQQIFHREGFRSAVLPPEALHTQDGWLYGPEGCIDIVYRRLVTRDYLPQQTKLPAIAEAARAGKTLFVAPFRTEIIHKKSFLAILSDPRFATLFHTEEREAIQECIPWTRLVRACRTTNTQGEEVSLLDWLQQEREHLVLKPTDGYGGKGVVLGWESSSADWEAALADAETRPYVVQERVPTPRSRYPLMTDEGLVFADLLEDFCPYIADAQVEGFLCRVSTHSLGNVSAGAYPIPVYTR